MINLLSIFMLTAIFSNPSFSTQAEIQSPFDNEKLMFSTGIIKDSMFNKTYYFFIEMNKGNVRKLDELKLYVGTEVENMKLFAKANSKPKMNLSGSPVHSYDLLDSNFTVNLQHKNGDKDGFIYSTSGLFGEKTKITKNTLFLDIRENPLKRFEVYEFLKKLYKEEKYEMLTKKNFIEKCQLALFSRK